MKSSSLFFHINRISEAKRHLTFLVNFKDRSLKSFLAKADLSASETLEMSVSTPRVQSVVSFVASYGAFLTVPAVTTLGPYPHDERAGRRPYPH